MEREELGQINNQEVYTNNQMIFNPNTTAFENQISNTLGQPLTEENKNVISENNYVIKETIEIQPEIIPPELPKNDEQPVKKKKIKIFNRFSKNKELNDLEEPEQIKPLVTSRLLFISILDKIFLISIILIFVVFTYNNFN